MGKTLVEIPVDEETARLFRALPDEDRSRMQEAVSALVREAVRTPHRTAVEIARESGHMAQHNGLTPNTLDELLRD